ncbi:MAG: nucleotidyltransferase, partial [Muribaculaceae bacterium]
GIKPNPERIKPWGTNHAVLMGKDIIKEPFAVINADDFYGYDSFKTLADALIKMIGKTNEYCMVGFRVGNTLSDSGDVSRGICNITDGILSTVTERHGIMRRDGDVSFIENDEINVIDDNTLVSMNMWGFTPDYFEYSEDFFIKFLSKNANELKAEFYIPTMVNELITSGKSTVKVYDTSSSWFGVTYADDKEVVVKKISNLIKNGEYPQKLF